MANSAPQFQSDFSFGVIPPMPDPNDIEQKTYEQAFAELESIVSILESNQRSLDQAMALFERGQALAQHCTNLLDRAELKVRQLSGEDLLPGEDAPDDAR
jgi:exodeoxyribonuclease VII small subunit